MLSFSSKTQLLLCYKNLSKLTHDQNDEIYFSTSPLLSSIYLAHFLSFFLTSQKIALKKKQNKKQTFLSRFG